MSNAILMQTFTKGMNGDADAYVLDLSQCTSVTNMLFERGLLISRPGLAGVAMVGATKPYYGTLDATQLVSLPQRGFYKCYDGANWSLRSVGRQQWAGNFLVDASITLPAGYVILAGGNPYSNYLSTCYFQTSDVIAGFQTAGSLPALVVISSGGAVSGVTLPTNVGKAVVLVTHLSRVVAATINDVQIAWCKVGDITTWTGDPSAGLAELPEVDDGITGLAVVNNTLVVARRFGMHLGVATGSTPPYTWKKLSSKFKGCMWPTSFAVYGSEVFYVSDTNVHRSDLNSVTDIGEGITTELFSSAASSGADIRAFITHSYKSGYRPQYHIFITSYTPGVSSKHYVYDITEGFWSKHTYDAFVGDTLPISACALRYEAVNVFKSNSTLALLRRSTPYTYYWADGVVCESTQQFVTGRIQFDDPTIEKPIVRVLVVAWAVGTTACTLTINSLIGNTTQTTGALSFTLNAGWNRVWVNKVVVGQFAQATVNIPASAQVKFRQLIFVVEQESQELRV